MSSKSINNHGLLVVKNDVTHGLWNHWVLLPLRRSMLPTGYVKCQYIIIALSELWVFTY